ncbi:YjhX family toxin [Paracoccus alkanivorans]|uniref:UPF0386 protein C9E81_14910 n=1 Tax=Paracoccus alkanivorans TaxID=2116655 RepID=A0A3M0MAU1_9RHOB|nr:YjhX family toxin [Paracoccus alkanivorans]RMC34425.1 hypothetical protein C9E81_14910 [Paracoccus alkanivorans]
MNISKNEQRVLHALAQGGRITYRRGPNGRIVEAQCFTREGFVLANCTLDVLRKLRRKRFIESRSGSAYRISELGRRNVRAQQDNR